MVFHTPGHTIGSCSFWYESPDGKDYLFTGDVFFLWKGKLITFILPNADDSNQSMIESLKIYKQFKPDVVLCSGAIGKTGVLEVTYDQWTKAIDQNIEKLSIRS